MLLFYTGYHFKLSIDGVPTRHYLEALRLCMAMLSGKTSYVLNGEDWGLGEEKLEEHALNVAEWDEDYASV